MRTLLERWWFWVAAVLVTAGIAFSGALIYAGQSKVAQANFNRIRFTMTQAEVVEILGNCAIRDYLSRGGVGDYWIDGPSAIRVIFHPDRTVQSKQFRPGTAWQRFKYKVRQCLGLPEEGSLHIWTLLTTPSDRVAG
jgi:hypothetical protein